MTENISQDQGMKNRPMIEDKDGMLPLWGIASKAEEGSLCDWLVGIKGREAAGGGMEKIPVVCETFYSGDAESKKKEKETDRQRQTET